MTKLNLATRASADAVVSFDSMEDKKVRRFILSMHEMFNDVKGLADCSCDTLCEAFNFIFDQANNAIEFLSRKTTGCSSDFVKLRSEAAEFANLSDMQQVQFLTFGYLMNHVEDTVIANEFRDKITDFCEENQENRNFELTEKSYEILFPAAYSKVDVIRVEPPYEITPVEMIGGDEVGDELKGSSRQLGDPPRKYSNVIRDGDIHTGARHFVTKIPREAAPKRASATRVAVKRGGAVRDEI